MDILVHYYAIWFRAYIGLFKFFGEAIYASHPTVPDHLDANAVLLGNAYRGSGVFVGVLGALIIFCAVAPFGFGTLAPAALLFFGIAEIVLMLWVIFTVTYVKEGHIKDRWIEARRAAEISRYLPLRACLSGSREAICEKVQSLLEGKDDQITYNIRKRDEYHAIERAANRATTAGFIVSLLAAIAHLIFHADALIFLTAFLPAAVGALHATNSFLKLEQLSEDHQRMVLQLNAQREEFLRIRASNDSAEARALAENLYELLTQGHEGWQNLARKLEVRMP